MQHPSVIYKPWLNVSFSSSKICATEVESECKFRVLFFLTLHVLNIILQRDCQILFKLAVTISFIFDSAFFLNLLLIILAARFTRWFNLKKRTLTICQTEIKSCLFSFEASEEVGPCIPTFFLIFCRTYFVLCMPIIRKNAEENFWFQLKSLIYI